jgi:hypothetical protein
LFETDSLRAGNYLPFHKAFDFHSKQRCGRLYDKEFSYLSLTNSRIQANYSLPIIDLFLASLADYLFSAGFITEDLMPLRRRTQFFVTQYAITQANDLLALLLAFDLVLHVSVTNLPFYEAVKFFALDISTFINAEHKYEIRYIESAYANSSNSFQVI